MNKYGTYSSDWNDPDYWDEDTIPIIIPEPDDSGWVEYDVFIAELNKVLNDDETAS